MEEPTTISNSMFVVESLILALPIAHCALVIAFIFARQAKFEPALD